MIVLEDNKRCMFLLSLSHIILGASAETEVLWKSCQGLFKEKRKNRRVSGACAASALG